MKLFICIYIQAIFINTAWVLGLPLNQNNITPYLANNFGLNNLAATSGISTVNPSFTSTPNGYGNFITNNIANANSIANNEALFNANFVTNNFAQRNGIANEIVGNRNSITNANAFYANEALIGNSILPKLNLLPNNVIETPSTAIQSELLNNMQFTPIISDFVPSLQYGDITMTGDLPIGGMIKVCGCFPVYGMVNVDGSLPSAGTAIVAESFGNQVIEIVNNCAHQVIG